MSSLRIFYGEKIKFYEAKISATVKRAALLSLLRLISFAGLAILGYFFVKNHDYLWLSGSLLLLIVFVGLVRANFRLKDQRALFEKLLFVNQNENEVIQNKPNRFDDGRSFLNQATYADDLDIFGTGSVFHLLNRTTTSHGTAQLSGLLSQPFLEKNEIMACQEANRVLTPQVDQRQLLTAHGLLHNEEKGNLHRVTQWLETNNLLRGQLWLQIVRWLLPLYNTFFAFYYLSTDYLVPLQIGVACSLLLTAFYLKYTNSQHEFVGKKQGILDQYAAILTVFNTIEAADSLKLQQLKSTTAQANKAIQQLSRLSSFFDQRMNLVIGFFFNALFVYDLQCLLTLENWKEKYKAAFADWINCVGDIECLNALSTFAYNNPGYSYPVIDERNLSIAAKSMAHPLIPSPDSVPNDFSIGAGNRLQLITGSNMSGKTTFLRTVGVNLLLAQCGAPVCAASFSFTPMDILSSIRISDSLQEHTSYFMAELKRLELIVQRLQSGKPALVLIDEILRGTNSEDKTYGSEQFIRKLLHYHCLSLFATHDLSLGVLQQEFTGVVSNYCFESVIENDELHFDYRLREGVAKNKNASFLMRKMDII